MKSLLLSGLMVTVALAQPRKLDPQLFPNLTFSVPSDSYWTKERAYESQLLSKIVNSCSPKKIMNFDYYNEAEGFLPRSTFFGEQFGAFGAIGTVASEKSIYIIFSHAIGATPKSPARIAENDNKLVKFEELPGCDCKIHRGARNSLLEVWPVIVDEI